MSKETFSRVDLPKIPEKAVMDKNLQKMEKLGEGTYGVVFKVINKVTMETFAMKKIRMDGQEEGIPSTTLREVCSLKAMSVHPCMVKLIKTMYESNNDHFSMYLLFEYCEYDLRKYMDQVCIKKNKAHIEKDMVKSFSYQLCHAISYMHMNGFLHRDLKPQNLLITSDNVLKIADLGLARTFCVPFRQYTHEIVTLWYRAPEVLLGEAKYEFGVDIWSVACIIAEMWRLKPLFRGDSEIDQLFHIFRVMGTPTAADWPSIRDLPEYDEQFPMFVPQGTLSDYIYGDNKTDADPKFIDMIDRLLKLDPSKRHQCSDVLIHPYFEGVQQLLTHLPSQLPSLSSSREVLGAVKQPRK